MKLYLPKSLALLAAAVMCAPANASVFLGTERDNVLNAEVYKFDTDTCVLELLSTNPTPAAGVNQNFNSNSLDTSQCIFYYNDHNNVGGASTTTPVSAYDISADSFSSQGVLPFDAAGSGYFDGNSYYIINEGNKLRRADYDGLTGLVPLGTGEESDFCTLTGLTGPSIRLGDISIDPMSVSGDTYTLYGFGFVSGSGTGRSFFSILVDESATDPMKCIWTEISSAPVSSNIQPSFDFTGALFGTNANNGEWFSVNKATGVLTEICAGRINSEKRLADIAHAGDCFEEDVLCE